ncbi:hypothetical protein CKM354_000884000 [Cercospora kikuchii]|uniref:DUF8032 domain-containing protein n=1 Tax=Cercospora kikuchii TaxID=84275 RepID=A0A9P3CMW8_9PEZI|nr:uncharacterized protein CKM354_000884000 [Cercospora kikuchii]GIZ45683.1 hypothetical protein CKM354_000884000 [Cercospora kikuchii]
MSAVALPPPPPPLHGHRASSMQSFDMRQPSLLNQPNAGQQGLPPPQQQQHHQQQQQQPPQQQQPLQHPRSAGLVQQQHRPNSPHQTHGLNNPTSQGPYISPHSSTHSLPQQHQSPYIGSVPGIPSQHPGEAPFFGAHPSPYSTNSAAGSYASSEPNETMATQAAISRQSYPPISSYQTPQSNSPASIHSPQTDAHGRPLYGIPSMPQQMYYPQYQMQQQSPYGQHPAAAASHHSSMTSAPGMLMSHQQPQQQMQQPQATPGHAQSNMLDQKPSQSALQRPPSALAPPQPTPQTPSGPAPGPIPATTPLVVRQDNNGVQWIAFEYSRDRVKMEYTIRCDVESVNVDELSPEFKSANCVYPRACCGKDQYKGNRLHYESECNAVGWALAQLNPNLREKRGLIQRAVDSWRNSNQDVRLRSRRVRRMAKIQNRNAAKATPGVAGPYPQGPGSAGLPPQGMAPGSARPPNMGPGGPQMHHHHTDGSDTGGGNDVSAGNEYNSAAGHPNQSSNGQSDLASPTTGRYANNFYPSYPQQPGVGGSSMPSVHDAMDPMHGQASTLATPARAESLKREDEEHKRNLFGDVPESKRRKFILVDDNQRGTRVRVRVMLDQVKMDDMPDAHLRINAVYPRSYFPRQMRSPPGSPGARGNWDDEDDTAEEEGQPMPPQGRTLVPVSLLDGSEAKLPVPRMTKSRRNKEVALNELGYRMSWGQARTFNGRTLFLQRSLDAYRNKMRSTMIAGGSDAATIAPHFETRPGKRKWLERNKRARRADSVS